MAGSHAEIRAVPSNMSWILPDNLSYVEAACVPVTFGTAFDVLFEFGQLKMGESVLIQAGASGVGIAAIQMAKEVNVTVYATASSQEKLDRLKQYGLDNGINYVENDFVEEVRHLTSEKGVNLVVDTVGGQTLQKSIECLGYRGRVISVGRAGRDQSLVDVNLLKENNQALIGYYLGGELLNGNAYQRIFNLFEKIASGKLKVPVDKKYQLSDAAAAHEYIESRKAIGRVYLIP